MAYPFSDLVHVDLAAVLYCVLSHHLGLTFCLHLLTNCLLCSASRSLASACTSSSTMLTYAFQLGSRASLAFQVCIFCSPRLNCCELDPAGCVLPPAALCQSGPLNKQKTFAIVRPTLVSAIVGFAWHIFLGLLVTEVLPVPSCALGEHWFCRTPHIILGFLSSLVPLSALSCCSGGWGALRNKYTQTMSNTTSLGRDMAEHELVLAMDACGLSQSGS